MKKKKIWLGIPVMVLVFGFLLTGCDLFNDLFNPSNAGTFEFRVSNLSMGAYVKWITEIEFINGSNENAPMLQKETITIKNDEMSGVYKVSGFTEKYENNAYLYGIRLTLYNGSDSWTVFKYAHAADKSKILVVLNQIGAGPNFQNGSW